MRDTTPLTARGMSPPAPTSCRLDGLADFVDEHFAVDQSAFGDAVERRRRERPLPQVADDADQPGGEVLRFAEQVGHDERQESADGAEQQGYDAQCAHPAWDVALFVQPRHQRLEQKREQVDDQERQEHAEQLLPKPEQYDQPARQEQGADGLIVAHRPRQDRPGDGDEGHDQITLRPVERV